MATYQVRVGTDGSTQEQIYTVVAKSVEAAEIKAVFGHDEKFGRIRYVATSVIDK